MSKPDQIIPRLGQEKGQHILEIRRAPDRRVHADFGPHFGVVGRALGVAQSIATALVSPTTACLAATLGAF